MSEQGEARARRLEQGVGALIASLGRSDPAALVREPGGEAWTAMQVLGHVAEFIPFWARRARGVAASDHDGIDFSRTPAEWDLRRASVEEEAQVPLETMLARLQRGTAEATTLLRAIPAGGWSKRGRHWEHGLMTVEELVDQLMLGHLEAHTAQARAAVGG